MNTPTNHFGLNKNLVKTAHFIMLCSILHMSIVAPAQEIAFLYRNFDKISKIKQTQTENESSTNQNHFFNNEDFINYNTISKVHLNPNNTEDSVPKTENTPSVLSFSSDLKEGIIGYTKESPIDYPNDNLFKVEIKELPSHEDKVYLTYDLYGVSDINGVARSINEKQSVGGYLIKQNNLWTTQSEEIDASWLKQGENTILFTTPKNSAFQYRIKNLRIDVQKLDAQNLNSLLVVNNNYNAVNNNKVYIKGFIRGNTNESISIEAEGQKLEVKQGQFEGVIELTDAIKKRNFIPIKATDQTGLLGQELFFLNTELPSADFLYPIENLNTTISSKIPAFKRSVLTTNGASLQVVDSALIVDKSISITQLRNIDIAPLGAGLQNVTKNKLAYRFLPDGTQFEKRVNITLEYDPKALPIGYTAKDIKTYYFDTKSKTWVALHVVKVDELTHQITSSTTHFTDYINGIIQSPESPETASFTPTTISDIKAADPSAGITLISPPEVSQKGDANISYPIKIPAGRKGMQPNLALQYNSEGGNGWLGLGWNINTPAITADTKWGVPNFVQGKETIIYTLNGEQLMYPRIKNNDNIFVDWMPNRHFDFSSTSTAPSTAPRDRIDNAVFSLRKKNDFSKVERLGTSPANYYWKVTSTDGTVNWYGGKNTVDNNAVIKNSEGNIVHWGLYMTEDVFGNNVKYRYTNGQLTIPYGNNSNLNGGRVFHIEKIIYTGYQESDGDYEVYFKPGQMNVVERNDISINGRLGVKQVEPHLLKLIEVKNLTDNNTIRKYELEYDEGVFNKKRLKSIQELDGGDVEFYKHTFDYYEEVRDKGEIFDSPVTIQVPNPNANFTLGFGNNSNIQASRINSGETNEFGWDVRLYPVGFQFFWKDNSPTNHIVLGFPFGESYPKSKGKITMSDMNGDGLDDVLFRTGNSLKYFPHIIDSNGNHTFDGQNPKQIININNFNKSEGVSKTMFLESFELGLFGKMFGRKRTKTKDETSIYITDGNGDQLPDIVNDNLVYFNNGLSQAGTNTFTTSSQNTPNMVITGDPRTISPDDVPDPEPGQSDLDVNYDVVRIWIAPRDGYIKITDNVIFTPTTPSSKAVYSIETIVPKLANNVPYRIYLKEFTTSVTNDSVDIESYATSPLPPLGVNHGGYMYIDKGQKFYFRLHKNEEGKNDVLQTSPKIRYYYDVNPPLVDLDQNGKDRNKYEYDTDFVLSGSQNIDLPGTGNVQISWNSLPINNLSDSVTFKVIKMTAGYTAVAPQEDELFSYVYNANTMSTLPSQLLNLSFSNLPAGSNISFKFLVTSDSNVDWQSINWKPKLEYTPDATAQEEGITAQTKYVVPAYSIFQEQDINEFIIQNHHYQYDNCGVGSNGIPDWVVSNNSIAYKVQANTYYNPASPYALSTDDNGWFYFVVKRNGILLGKRKVTIQNGQIQVDGPAIEVYTGDATSEQVKISTEFYVTGANNLQLFNDYTAAVSDHLCYYSATFKGLGNVIIGTADEWNNYGIDDYQHFWRFKVDAHQRVKEHLGTLYRGWGQFMYNDEFDNATNPVTPNDSYSKLVNNEIIENPTLSLAESLGIDTSSCESLSTNEAIADCIADQISNELNLPSPDMPIDQGTVEGNTVGNILDGVLSNLNLTNIQQLGCFLPMNSYRNIDNQNVTTEKWVGLVENQYSSSVEMLDGDFTSSELGQAFENPDDEESPLLIPDSETGMNAITKTQKSVAVSYSAGGSITYASSKSSYSNMDSDFMDVNGDRYPDLLITDNAQTTTMTGGHKQAVSGGYGISVLSTNDCTNSSLSLSKSYPVAGRKGTDESEEDSGNPSYSLNLGVSANLTGSNQERSSMLDLNGDGLPDRVLHNGTYRYQLNLGKAFTGTPDNFSELAGIKTKPSTFGVNFGLSTALGLGNIPVSVSLGYSSSGGNTETSFQDLNGDGLVDLLKFNGGGLTGNPSGTVQYNLGNGFSSTPQPIMYNSTDLHLFQNNKSSSASLSGNATYFYGYPICCGFAFVFIPIIYYKFGGAVGLSANLTVSQTNKDFRDFNNDGFVDFVEKDGTNLKVYYSKIGKTDKLKSVSNPLGGKFTIDYKVQKSDYNSPNAKWAMSEVKIEDGFDFDDDGSDEYIKTFEYENGKYDRRERSFFGYATVRVKEHKEVVSGGTPELYRTTENKYHNDSYFLEGMLKSSLVSKNGTSNNIYSQTSNKYEVKKIKDDGTIDLASSPGDNFDVGGTEGRRQAAVLLKETTTTINNFTGSQLQTKIALVYDGYGRVEKYLDYGNIQTTSDDYRSEITYHTLNNNILNVPKTLKVFSSISGSSLKRYRETEVANNNNGFITGIKAFLGTTPTSDHAYTKFENDVYGNLKKIIFPPNESGDSMYYEYKYDTFRNKYVTEIENAFGYNSVAEYNPNFDTVNYQDDIAGNRIRYEYDNFGRLTKVIGPKEATNTDPYTIKFEYMPTFGHVATYGYNCANSQGFTPLAITKHYDSEHPTNPIETYTFMDGLARPLQVKKDIQLNNGTPQSPSYVEAMSVSGIASYDEFGRSVKQYLPLSEPKNCIGNFIFNENTGGTNYFSQIFYDEVNRTVKTIDPEGNESNATFGLANDAFGSLAMLEKLEVDQNGTSVKITTETFKDVDGKVSSTKNIGASSGDIITKFNYNSIGELLYYEDNEGLQTGYKYDLLGRKTVMQNPDRGTTLYYYDKASNLTKIQTANLAGSGLTDPYIRYSYEFNRLSGITFPQIGSNTNISDVSYKYGDTGNQTGRLIYQQDASGTQEFEYGNMGELIWNKRTIVGPNIPTRTFATEFEYDSWNRIKYMKYPDEEKIFYKYDLGGNLSNLIGSYQDNEYHYIKQIDYDAYEQRTYLLYGNGAETFYDYTPELRRLYKLNVKTSSGEDMLKNTYSYDQVGNVLNIENEATYNTFNNLGGKYTHRFEYDKLNRLTGARGFFEGYIEEGVQNHSSDYRLSMKYNSTHGIFYKEQEHTTQSGSVQNPLNSYANDYKYHDGTHMVSKIGDVNTNVVETFKYDSNGNLTHKQDSNGGERYLFWDESDRLRVINENHEMQHYIYDASGERVLKASSQVESVYENGELTNSNVVFGAYTTYVNPYMVIDAQQQYSKHYYAGTQRVVSKLGEYPVEIFDDNPLPRVGNSAEKKTTTDYEAIKQSQIRDLNAILDKAKRGVAKFADYKPETEEQVEEEEEQSEIQRAAQFVGLYYYHPDHLGTSTFLTDGSGMPYQFFLNLPFGETMYEQHSYAEDFENRYKFNGKELDEETGLYYYGARYYDPRTSIWLSVDPLAEKYPNSNPYVYCHNNPISMIDPDGRDAILITFPNYKVDTGVKFTVKNPFTGKPLFKVKSPKLELGHSGVLIIDNKTGVTSYYEYGRYDAENKGIVRKVSVSNVIIGKDGKPTQESLDKVLGQISKNSGHGGKIEGAYIESDKAKEMKAYAESKMKENNDADREPYTITGNNCATFAADVVNQDPNVERPNVVYPTPGNVVNEYQEEGYSKVTFDPKTQKAAIDKD